MIRDGSSDSIVVASEANDSKLSHATLNELKKMKENHLLEIRNATEGKPNWLRLNTHTITCADMRDPRN